MAVFRTRFMVAAALTFLVVASLTVGSRGIIAQDATPEGEAAAIQGRPIHIHGGTCDELGDVIYPLNPVEMPDGETQGNADATSVETSVTTVDVALADLLAEDYAINAHLSDDEIGTYIACGEIGGVPLVEGAIAIGLRQQDGSGFAGIAYLSPSPDNAAQTNVSVFLAEGLTGASNEATPEASPVS